ncbi:hypothetical protein GCK72_016070 [Caenorhabditis remanei]|uniref:Cyclic nucleotide-binding domain-containing protein n=1 Tax=Caenorhabditis remanei TaxID=31234 RepID=A0A6A5GYX3_CAERE|nr:hypothetical protein GCK72_016070 [Caenorhabditis remanei]KAF1759603.1 hypothetical protein GCK72_016070 [Caenorhabditis remanei]
MFATFNFEESPELREPPKRSRRRDRSVKYLRALSAKNNQGRTQHDPSQVPGPSNSAAPISSPHTVISMAETVAPVLQAQLPAPRPGILRVPSNYPSDDEAHPSTSTASNPRRESRWAVIRERSPQIVSKEKTKKLDLNKGRMKSRSAGSRDRKANRSNPADDGNQKSFSDVVKTAMMLRNWISAMEHDERESEPDGDPTTTNAEHSTNTTVNSEAPLVEIPPMAFAARPTGWAQTRDYLKEKWYQLRYFYVTENSTFFYYWSAIITLGVLYNMCAMVIFIFDDVHQGYFWQWVYMNTFFDVIFLLDCVVGARMTFVHEGNEVRETTKMWRNYKRSQRFKLDAATLIPADLILFILSEASLIRIFRMIKIYRLYEFIVLTQRRTDFPHFMKILFLSTSCAILFHWNACVYFLFSLAEGLSEDDTNAFGFSYYKVFDPRFPICTAFVDEDCWYPEDQSVLDIRDERIKYMQEMYKFWEDKFSITSLGNFSREYSMTIYWSSLTITKCGQQPWPSSSLQNALEIFDTLIGVLVFATIIGGVGSVVTQMSQNVNMFREMMDGIKFYMKYRGVQSAIQDRVLNCFLYLNTHNQLYDEEEILSLLPPRFQANIAANLHQETLSKVALFYRCDPRLLQEVVMLVKQQVYSPNDYLCRKNEKAKEMYLVKKGTLSVLEDDDNMRELDTLREGSTFGELSLVHVKGNLLGDRRSVSLRSVGYSDVYILHQDDMTRLLQEYPDERKRLLENARRMLHSRGLLETNELGEMCDNTDDMDDEQMLDFLSVDEQLNRLEGIIEGIDKELGQMVASFSHTSVFFKKRVTALEEIYNSNKKRIRADLYNGILKTDYDDKILLI